MTATPPMRLQIDDELGTAVVYLKPLEITPAQRAALAQITAELSPTDRDFVLTQFIRQVADEDAYDRVCAERGLLL